MALSAVRRIAVDESREPLPLHVLIALWEERMNVAKAEPRLTLGGVAELIEQTLPRLRRLQQLEARGA